MPTAKKKLNGKSVHQMPCGCDWPHPATLHVFLCHPDIKPVFSCPACPFWSYDGEEARRHALLSHVENTVRALKAIIHKA